MIDFPDYLKGKVNDSLSLESADYIHKCYAQDLEHCICHNCIKKDNEEKLKKGL